MPDTLWEEQVTGVNSPRPQETHNTVEETCPRTKTEDLAPGRANGAGVRAGWYPCTKTMVHFLECCRLSLKQPLLQMKLHELPNKESVSKGKVINTPTLLVLIIFPRFMISARG